MSDEKYAVDADYGTVAVFDTKPQADEFVRKNECTDEYRCQLYVRRLKPKTSTTKVGA